EAVSTPAADDSTEDCAPKQLHERREDKSTTVMQLKREAFKKRKICEEEADCCTVVSVLFESRRDVSCRAKRAASSSRTRESSASVCSFVSRANIKASSSSNILDSSSALRDSNVDLVIFSSSMRNSRGPKNLLLRSPNEQSHRDRTVGKLKG
ncbi:hypothetical protein X801_03449, partial [Opisthorchis viverrini]